MAAGGLLYLTSLHSNRREREACFNLSAESISLSPSLSLSLSLIRFNSVSFLEEPAFSFACIIQLKQFVVDRMKREEDSERERETESQQCNVWASVVWKQMCFFLSVSHSQTQKRSCSKSRCRDIFTNFILSIWPTGSFRSVLVSPCGSRVWFQPHEAG